MIRSPLRYPGGKSRALRHILPLLPEGIGEYREPFLGGGSVFVRLRQAHPEWQFWINDRYEALFWFWKMVQERPQDLLQQVKDWRVAYADGKKLHQFLKSQQDAFTPLQIAAAFFIFNRITFSGTSEAGGYSRQAFEKRFTTSSIERVEALQSLLSPPIRITNLDYEVLLSAPTETQCFIFLDPPYYSATKSALYGKNGKLHRYFDHERLRKALKNCPHHWLMTYDDSAYIRELYQEFELRAWDLTYGMRNVSPDADAIGKELFIANYTLPETVTE